MKKLLYVNGHFYDAETKARVKIEEGTEITVTSETNISKADKVGKHPKLKDSAQLERMIKNKPNVRAAKKAFDKGKRLYFAIPWGQEGREINHEFEVELLEDLYFYLRSKSKKDESRLFDCACVVIGNPGNSIKMFEKVYGKSLNQVFKNTYVHYFGNIGNPACNAIDRFYEEVGKEEKMINKHRIVEEKTKTT